MNSWHGVIIDDNCYRRGAGISIDYRREERAPGWSRINDRIITLGVILLSLQGGSLILREGIRLNFISSISIDGRRRRRWGIISSVGSSARNNRPNNGDALSFPAVCFYKRTSRRRRSLRNVKIKTVCSKKSFFSGGFCYLDKVPARRPAFHGISRARLNLFDFLTNYTFYYSRQTVPSINQFVLSLCCRWVRRDFLQVGKKEMFRKIHVYVRYTYRDCCRL